CAAGAQNPESQKGKCGTPAAMAPRRSLLGFRLLGFLIAAGLFALFATLYLDRPLCAGLVERSGRAGLCAPVAYAVALVAGREHGYDCSNNACPGLLAAIFGIKSFGASES